MSEYQRYEFMTVDRPLTRAQLDAVNGLSSHIEASSTHAVIEYHWGDFKHDPMKVLHKYFDGFLYWANWGSPQLALRFPHAALPANLLDEYDCDEYVTFTQHPDYDILHFNFGEMEPPDEWVSYELGSLTPLRDELMAGDLRALYIGWLGSQPMISGAYGDEDYERDDDEDEDEQIEEDSELRGTPPISPAFDKLTAAQQALAELLRVPGELLAAAGQHSKTGKATSDDHFAAWIELLPLERRNDYLVRFAQNEPGLSRVLAQELRELGRGKTPAQPATGERVPYATLYAESKSINARWKREEHERQRQARLSHLQDIHAQQDTYWRQVEQEATRGTSTGYAEAVKLLVDLRDAAEHFNETPAFQTRFSAWVQPHLRRTALVRRLRESTLLP